MKSFRLATLLLVAGIVLPVLTILGIATAAGPDVTTLAGSGTPGMADGAASTARFSHPMDVALDSAGNVYVADEINHSIRKVSPSGMVTTLAGAGKAGFSDGPGAVAEFSSPIGVAVDASGNVYVADLGNHRIRKVSPSGMVTTFAGSGTAGFADGPASQARFANPASVAVDAGGSLYVADLGNLRIRKVSPSGAVTTMAGSGTKGFSDGPGSTAEFNRPNSVAVDLAGNVYVADDFNNRIRKVGPGGLVTTLAGAGTAGFSDGPGAVAEFSFPTGVAVDTEGNVYVAEAGNNRIRKVSPIGVVTTIAVPFLPGAGVAVDAAGNVYVADRANHRIRKLSFETAPPPTATVPPPTATVPPPATPKATNLVVTTLAGSGKKGFADGPGISAEFNGPRDVSVDSAGNVFVADRENNKIRKVSPSGNVTTLAGTGINGRRDGPGDVAQFYYPAGVEVDAAGNVYVAGLVNHNIRKVSPSGVVTTIAGSTTSGRTDGPVATAKFGNPAGLALDVSGNLHVADRGGWARIRKVSPDGVVTTTAGSGFTGFADGPGSLAKFSRPTSVAVDSAGNVYVADQSNHRIRKVSPTEMVTTLAGSGTEGFSDGPGATARFSSPTGLALDAAGNIYVADSGNNRIRVVSPSGVVTTFAGSGTAGFANGALSEAKFNNPAGLAVDAAGNVYVADRGNNRIRKISPEISDAAPPTVTVPPPVTLVATGPSGAIHTFSSSATDNVDGAVPATCIPTSGFTFPLGDTTVICTAIDAAGHEGSANFTVTVNPAVPTEAPPLPTIPAPTLTPVPPAPTIPVPTATPAPPTPAILAPTATPVPPARTIPVPTATPAPPTPTIPAPTATPVPLSTTKPAGTPTPVEVGGGCSPSAEGGAVGDPSLLAIMLGMLGLVAGRHIWSLPRRQ